MSNLLGAATGAAIDRRHGNSGIKGAVAGLIVQSVVRTAVSLLATAAVGWVIKEVLTRTTRGSGSKAPADSATT